MPDWKSKERKEKIVYITLKGEKGEKHTTPNERWVKQKALSGKGIRDKGGWVGEHVSTTG